MFTVINKNNVTGNLLKNSNHIILLDFGKNSIANNIKKPRLMDQKNQALENNMTQPLENENLYISTMRGVRDIADKIQDGLNGTNLFLIALAVAVFALTSLVECFYKTRHTGDMRNLLFVLYEFNIRQAYASQLGSTHDAIFGGVASGLRGGGSTVLMLAAGRGARCTAMSLAAAVARVASSATGTPPSLPMRGQDYSSGDDYWPFRMRLREILARHKLAIVSGFELLHPQVATAVSHISIDQFSPSTQGVVLLVLDTGERFSQRQLTEENASNLAVTAVRECLEPFLDATALEEIIRTVTWRSALIVNDPRHKPSLCTVCNLRP